MTQADEIFEEYRYATKLKYPVNCNHCGQMRYCSYMVWFYATKVEGTFLRNKRCAECARKRRPSMDTCKEYSKSMYELDAKLLKGEL